MGQDRASGAKADQRGREKGKDIARALGARDLSKNSNECTLNDVRTVIKSARVGNNKIGVPYKMLPRVSRVIAGFEKLDGTFELFELTSAQFQAGMSPTASTGNSQGKVGMVARSYFQAHGASRGTVRV